jgi:hypothetical protein
LAEFYKVVNRFFPKIELSRGLDKFLEALQNPLNKFEKSAKNVRLKNIFAMISIVILNFEVVFLKKVFFRDTTF